jgi:RND family efflux transporter MFP subunit
VRAELAPIAASRSFVGTIRSRHEADLGFRAGGRIAARLVDAGARVTAGQVLARLDPADLTLALRAAEAEVLSAEAAATQTAAEAERSRVLRAQGHVSASLDDQRQAAARAAAERLAAATAARDLARNRLGHASLLAPADGVVTAVLADAGTVVAEGTPVLRLADPAQLEALVPIPEDAVADLPAHVAEVAAWARPGQRLPATLREVSPQADPLLRTYAARFALPAPPPWLALGMTATVTLRQDAAGRAAVLPVAALHDRGQGPMVWTVDPAAGRVAAQPVRVRALRQDAAILDGVPDGALVVALGVQKLDPAARVRITEVRPVPRIADARLPPRTDTPAALAERRP